MRRHRFGFCLALAWTLLLPPGVYAQDVREESLDALGVGIFSRTSPFEPPIDDVFVADFGPGLDTGCTFNTDPEHPLVIDVTVDRAVGPVDANGFLVNPAPLVAKGIIPATVEVIMPAFDVDVNGAPPPERDEVLLNGESLGLLTGDNNIWKLNGFTVDIRKIKFPAPPPAGGSPTPVVNKVQINIDLLSQGRWCTSIDWVAFVVPIRPVVALTLEPRGGNRVRQNASEDTIDVIFKQTLDADCNVTTDIGPYDEYPFSAPSAPAAAKLRAKIEACPAGSLTSPEVKVDWTIGGTGQSGTSTWTGLEGDVDLNMPALVGAYAVDLKFDIDGEANVDITRKLFVTKATPLAQVNPPRRAWYEKATTWANGLADEGAIVRAVLDGLYGYGNASWRYGYNFGAAARCVWEQLVADPLTCNYGDCFMFSDVLENISATLGVGGLGARTPLGSNGLGFLTVVSPSLDPAFPGNAKPLGGGGYDRYLFSSHSLREKGGSFYDSTFDKVYGSETAFIAANLDGGVAVDANGVYNTTVEGTRIYVRAGNAYDSWGNYEYALATPFVPFALEELSALAVDIEFTGSAAFEARDPDLDGIAEALVADVEVEVLTPGLYTILGILKKGSQVIANRPSLESMLTTRANLDRPAGTYTVSLQFSGEQIFRSGEDGPYEVQLFAIGGSSPATATIATPAFDHRSFGELGAAVTAVGERAVDDDGDGRFEAIELTVELLVRSAGEYRLQADLSQAGRSIAAAGTGLTPSAGVQSVILRLPGQAIRRADLDGPYSGIVSLLDAESHNLGSTRFTTQAYLATDFAALFLPDGRFTDAGVDTNGNGLFELLRVTFGLEVTEAGSYLVSGVLRSAGTPLVVFTEQSSTLAAGLQDLTLTFSGPLIHRQAIDGPYEVEVVARDPETFAELDRVTLPRATAAYRFTDFETLEGPVPPIALTGRSVDVGLDVDGNGLFDELLVDLQIALTQADFYQWSARLVDAHGTEIGFDTGSGSLPAGITSIGLAFDGERIGQNGVDGPYFVKGLLIFGSRGASLVAVDAAETQPYRVFEFEGANRPPVADAGPDQTVECTSPAGAEVTLDGTGSYDPDEDVLTFTWSGPFGSAFGPSPTVMLPLGTHLVTLVVDDGKGGTGTDNVVVSVVDTTAPLVTAALVPVGEIDDDEGRFMIRFTCEDRCDTSPTAVATLNGISVQDGQRVYLELHRKTKAKYRHGVLRSLKAPSFELLVRCTDASGNTGSATAVPVFEDDDDDDDDDDD